MKYSLAYKRLFLTQGLLFVWAKEIIVSVLPSSSKDIFWIFKKVESIIGVYLQQ